MQSAQWHKNETHQTGHPTRIYKTSWIYSSSAKNSTENIYSQSQKLKFKKPEQAPNQNGSCEKQEKPKTNKITRTSRRSIEKESNSWSDRENWYFINHKYSSISDVITPKDSWNKKKQSMGLDNRHQQTLQLKNLNAYQRISNLTFATQYVTAQKFKSHYQTTFQKHPKM